MKYLHSWLKEFYPELPPVDELGELLVKIGHDVEGVERINDTNIVIGEITKIEPHPNADRLTVVDVFDGQNHHSVVCGAPNLRVGQLTAYARVGAILADGETIKAAKIRGIDSAGMLCAADELGLGLDHSELLPIPRSAKPGQTLAEAIGADAVITIDVTANRGDVLSHYGLARDIAAALGDKIEPSFHKQDYDGDTATSIAIDQTIHPDVRAFALAEVKVEEMPATPIGIVARLILLGGRSINIPTDITNYLSLAYGQPMHAYDADKLPQNARFGVRRARNEEKIVGLNGTEYQLTPQALVITANDSPIALAGVLGGDATKVSESTKRVVFECANFAPKPIRLASRGLGISTDASYLYERDVDPSLMLPVLGEAEWLMTKFTNAAAARPISRVNQSVERRVVNVAWEKINDRLGTKLPADKLAKIVTVLGCQVETRDTDVAITVPSWRPDLSIADDISEEIARIVGLDSIPKQPLSPLVPQWKRSHYWRLEAFKDVLTQQGGIELCTYPFVNLKELELLKVNPNEVVELRAPANEDKKYMRPSLLPTLLQAVACNPDVPSLVLFELAKTYRLDSESESIGIVVASNSSNDNDHWWQNFFERLRLPVSSWMNRVVTVEQKWLDFYKIRKSAVTELILPADEFIGAKGLENVNVVIPDLDAVKYTAVSKYQASRRDIAMIVERNLTPEIIAQAISALDESIIDVGLFDRYTNDSLGENKQSLAFHVFYQSSTKTFSGDEINALHAKVENFVKEKFHALIR